MVDCIRSYLNSLTIPEAGLQPLPATEGQPSQDTEQYDDEGDPLRTQIDELLMQMSIQDDGQVSTSRNGADCRMGILV